MLSPSLSTLSRPRRTSVVSRPHARHALLRPRAALSNPETAVWHQACLLLHPPTRMTSHPLAPCRVQSPRLTPSSNAAACAISPRSRPLCRLARPRTMLHASRCAPWRCMDALLRLSTPSRAVWRRITAVSPRGAVSPRSGGFSPALSFHARERDVHSPPNNAARPSDATACYAWVVFPPRCHCKPVPPARPSNAVATPSRRRPCCRFAHARLTCLLAPTTPRAPAMPCIPAMPRVPATPRDAVSPRSGNFPDCHCEPAPPPRPRAHEGGSGRARAAVGARRRR
ncbi:hypothetical protein DENSPDRAFT_845969 [Dentipellis sp. KUC8613]|nr:hypothetical protein DENSPDRAFT_845969 [Dentipellis sp. KUC8613]